MPLADQMAVLVEDLKASSKRLHDEIAEIKIETERLRQDNSTQRDQTRAEVESICRETEEMLQRFEAEFRDTVQKTQKELGDYRSSLEERVSTFLGDLHADHAEARRIWRHKSPADTR